jgi:hypothetical protein
MNNQLNWKQALLLQLITGLILITCTYGLTRNGQKVDRNDEYIKSLAKTVYVDERDKILDAKIDTKLDKETFATYLKSQENYQTIIINDLSDIKKHLFKTDK